MGLLGPDFSFLIPSIAAAYDSTFRSEMLLNESVHFNVNNLKR
jgi:hypothetical protein